MRPKMTPDIFWCDEEEQFKRRDAAALRYETLEKEEKERKNLCKLNHELQTAEKSDDNSQKTTISPPCNEIVDDLINRRYALKKDANMIVSED